MSRQALGLQGERWKSGRNARFFPEESNECLPNFEVFNENEFLQICNDLDDSEISLLIEVNGNVNTTKKTKSDLNVWKRWCEAVKETRAIEEIPAEELNNLLCHFFVKVRKRNPSFLRKCLQQMHNCWRSEISTAISFKTTRGYWFRRRWLRSNCVLIVNKLLFNFVWLDFRVLFVLSSSFFSEFYSVTKNIIVNPIVNSKIIQFCFIPSLFSSQVWNKITTFCSIDRFDKFSFLTNQQQPHIKRAKPGPAGPLTRC